MTSGLALLALLIAAPTPTEVRAAEDYRVIQPLISYAKDGRGFVEFAPDVETRDEVCEPTRRRNTFHCTYDARVRRAFAREFGPWEARDELVRRNRYGWFLVPQLSKADAIRRGCAAIRRGYAHLEHLKCSELDATLSGPRWVVTIPRDPRAAIDEPPGAAISRRDGRVEGVWAYR